MLIDTRYFGRVEIEDAKIIHFEKGLFGFREYQDFTLLYDSECEGEPFFSWLQSVDEKGLAFPVVNPLKIKEDYNPTVEEAILEPIGHIEPEDLVVLLLATVPADPKGATVNMKAPLIINVATQKGIQVIVENNEYPVKYKLIQE